MKFPGLGKPSDSIKASANKHEKRLAKKLGAKRQPNSGATPGAKGDIKTPEILFDSKQTGDTKITVTSEMLGKISLEAQQINRYPGLILTLQTHLLVSSEWAMIPLDYFKQLSEELTNLRRFKNGIVNGREAPGGNEASRAEGEGNAEA